MSVQPVGTSLICPLLFLLSHPLQSTIGIQSSLLALTPPYRVCGRPQHSWCAINSCERLIHFAQSILQGRFSPEERGSVARVSFVHFQQLSILGFSLLKNDCLCSVLGTPKEGLQNHCSLAAKHAVLSDSSMLMFLLQSVCSCLTSLDLPTCFFHSFLQHALI